MRALFWIIGALASAAGGALIVNHRAKRRLSGGFLEALRNGHLDVEAYEPSIISAGFRAEAFRGTAGGKPFMFVAKTDSTGTKWTYALAWGSDRMITSWNPLSGEAEHPLQKAYIVLRRRTSKNGGIFN